MVDVSNGMVPDFLAADLDRRLQEEQAEEQEYEECLICGNEDKEVGCVCRECNSWKMD